MDGVEFSRLRLGHVEHAGRANLEALLLQVRDDFAGFAGTERVEVPVGAAMFPGEIFRPSRRWAERSYNIVHWSEPPRGGHFAACEVPDLFVEEVRSFFRRVR